MSNTSKLKKKLEDEAGVVFKKDTEADAWVATVDGHIIAIHKYQGDCVYLAAKEFGE